MRAAQLTLAFVILSLACAFAAEPATSAQVQESIQRSLVRYPSSGDSSSPLYKAIEAQIEVLKNTDPDFFSAGNWPEILTACEAARLGEKPATIASDGELRSKLKLVFDMLASKPMSGADRVTAVETARSLGIYTENGINQIQLSYYKAIFDGASESDALAARSTALLEQQNQLLAEQNALTREQMNNEQRTKRELQTRRPDLYGPAKQFYPAY